MDWLGENDCFRENLNISNQNLAVCVCVDLVYFSWHPCPLVGFSLMALGSWLHPTLPRSCLVCSLLLRLLSFWFQEHMLAGFPTLLGPQSYGVSLTYGPSVTTSKDDLPNRWDLLNIYVWTHLFWTWKCNKAFHFLKRWRSLSVVSRQPAGVSSSVATLRQGVGTPFGRQPHPLHPSSSFLWHRGEWPRGQGQAVGLTQWTH